MESSFSVYDYLVFAIILSISVSIGFYHAIIARYGSFRNLLFRKSAKVSIELELEEKVDDEDSKNSEKKTKMGEYLTANSSLGPIPVALSLLATFFSSTALLGFPAEVYQYGIQYWISVFGMMIPTLFGAFIFGPMYARLKILSVFEYFQRRFDSTFIRLLGVSYYLLRVFIGMGIVIYGPATTLNLLTSLSPDYAIGIIGALATLYTTIGGIKAVIYSDAFQLTIMFGGIITIISKGIYDVGGISELWKINNDGGRLNFLDFNPNPLVRQSFWPLFIGNLISWLMPYCMDQQMVQRFASAKSIKSAQLALLLNIPGVFFLISLCCFTGLVMYANFAQCDPLSYSNITKVKNPNQIVPYFVISKLSIIPGSAGLFLGAIFCASLSSVSSALNSMSAIIWQDFLKRFKYFQKMNDSQSTFVTKLIVLICGIICTADAFLISKLGSNLSQISSTINGALSAPLIGLFLLGVFVPFANIFGVTIGTIFGLGVGIWINLGSTIYKPNYPKLTFGTGPQCYNNTYTTNTTTTTPNTFAENLFRSGEATNLTGFNKIYSISYAWYGAIGVITSVVIGVLVSLATIRYSKKPDEETIVFFNCKKKIKKHDNTETNELSESTKLEKNDLLE